MNKEEPWRTTCLEGGDVGKGVHQNYSDGLPSGTSDKESESRSVVSDSL